VKLESPKRDKPKQSPMPIGFSDRVLCTIITPSIPKRVESLNLLIQFPNIESRTKRRIAYELEVQIAETTERLRDMARLMEEMETNAYLVLKDYYALTTELFLLVQRFHQLEEEPLENMAPYPIIQLELF